MICTNYKICHFDIATDLNPITDDCAPAYYCVFWFRSVPLGHAFLRFKEVSSYDGLLRSCLAAVHESLQHYAVPVSITCRTFAELQKSCIQYVLPHVPFDQQPSCDLSVLICTRNRASSLKNCLGALKRQISAPKEIIVVDNGSSTDETKKVAHEYNVKYVREDKPGLDIARNTGARLASAAIIAYTDDDTLPHPHWTYQVCKTFNNPEVKAMTGLVLAGTLDTEAEVIFEKFWAFNRGYLPKTFGETFFRSTLPMGPPVWEIGAGANMAFRKEVFQQVGYFDERLDVGAAGCSGDSEMWYRILAAAGTIQYNPLAIVKHFHRSSIAALKAQLHAYMRGFTVAILIQYARFGHRGNLRHLFAAVPRYYLTLLRKGFPYYRFQYQTLFSEIVGIFSGLMYYFRNRKINSGVMP